ncbi:MAG: restriction endonuclease subunit S [Ruminococcus sp.]|nr:restriction endonuclease subunit S [Ruminococcus sp.]
MKSETVRLGDICKTNTNSYSVKEKWEYVNYLDTGNITENKIDNIQYIDLSSEKLPSRARRKVSENDIIFSTVRPNQLHYGFIKEIPENFLVSTGFTTITANEKICFPKYLYYFLTQNYIINYLHTIAEQSTSAYPSIKSSDIEDLQIKLPELSVQRQIASVLSALDGKIELNNKINQNLEEQAQAIFKSWFVDFEPFGGVMPDDWRIGKVSDINMTVTDYVANGSFASLKANVKLYKEKNYAYFIRNTDLKAGNFNIFVDKHSYDFLTKSVLYGGEIIISNVGDVGSVFLCPKLDLPMTLGNNIIMLRPNNYIFKYYLYIWFKWGQGQNYIQAIKSGSAQPKFNKTEFKNTPVQIPSEEILKKFHTIVTPLFNKIGENKQENKRLSDLRDVLLPELMNGRINI